MKVTPKYAHIYRNATMLLRPKTQLQDITVEINPGTPSAGKLPSGSTLPLSQTAPNVNFDEFLSSLDAETRAYLQELLAGAGGAFKNNGKAFSATLKRFDPTAREIQKISSQLEQRHANTARAIHNFRLLTEALGGKDKELAQLVDASNAVFATFAKEDKRVERTLQLLPGALSKTKTGLGKLATAAHVLGPTLHKLAPFAKSLGPANNATRKLAIDDHADHQERNPPVRARNPADDQPGRARHQGAGRSVPQARHELRRVQRILQRAREQPGQEPRRLPVLPRLGQPQPQQRAQLGRRHGILGRTLVYFNCEVAPLLKGVAEVNPNVNLLVGLLNPPPRRTARAQGILKGAAAVHNVTPPKAPGARVLGGLSPAFGKAGGEPEVQARTARREGAREHARGGR